MPMQFKKLYSPTKVNNKVIFKNIYSFLYVYFTLTFPNKGIELNFINRHYILNMSWFLNMSCMKL